MTTVQAVRQAAQRWPRFSAALPAMLALALAGGAWVLVGRMRAAAPPAAAGAATTPARLPLRSLHLPPGFSIGVFSSAVPGARSMTLSPRGILYVGTRDEGKVYALVGGPGLAAAGGAPRVLTVASGLDLPNGVAWRDGSLYVAEVSRLLRFDGIDERLAGSGDLAGAPPPRVLDDSYPKEHHHGWKFIRFGPDGLLYVPVGAPCNICLPDKPIYASITRLRPDGGGREVFAHGVRNTVGFDWQPETHELWFTDNGRDYLGDDHPPDELNRAPRAGMHFGYPFCHGGNVSDPELGKGHPCTDFTPPELELPAHVASLGMRFYTGAMFPREYRGRIFIAEHGSWNRSVPIGYRVVSVPLRGGHAVAEEPFAYGWLPESGSGLLGRRVAWGRPVDVQELPDGSLLVSDDMAGAIYRITYAAPAPAKAAAAAAAVPASRALAAAAVKPR
jgi:glucose/arabinose dehydrogenase